MSLWNASSSLMVLDLMLPGASGADLLERLRKLGRRVPTVVVSGVASDSSLATLSDDDSVSVVLAKPFDKRLLRAAIIEAARSAQG